MAGRGGGRGGGGGGGEVVVGEKTETLERTLRAGFQKEGGV